MILAGLHCHWNARTRPSEPSSGTIITRLNGIPRHSDQPPDPLHDAQWLRADATGALAFAATLASAFPVNLGAVLS